MYAYLYYNDFNCDLISFLQNVQPDFSEPNVREHVNAQTTNHVAELAVCVQPLSANLAIEEWPVTAVKISIKHILKFLN